MFLIDDVIFSIYIYIYIYIYVILDNFCYSGFSFMAKQIQFKKKTQNFTSFIPIDMNLHQLEHYRCKFRRKSDLE